MKITIKTKDLRDVMGVLTQIIPNKTILPSLSCVYIKTINEDEIVLVTNNLETSIKKTLRCKVEEDGEVLVEAKMLLNTLKVLNTTGQDEITLSSNSNGCTLKSGKSKFKFNVQKTEDFPFIEVGDCLHNIAINSEVLLDAIYSVNFATIHSETQPLLKGVNFRFNSSKVRLQALDGYRAAMTSKEITDISDEFSATITADVLEVVIKLIKDDKISTDINMSFSKLNVVIKVLDYDITTKLLQGDFIDLEKILPRVSEKTGEVIINKTNLNNLLKKAQLLVDDKTKAPVIIEYKDEFNVSINTRLGSLEDVTTMEESNGEIKIGLNIKYLIDAISACKGDFLKFRFSGPYKGVVITSQEDDGSLYLVLPVRFRD